VTEAEWLACEDPTVMLEHLYETFRSDLATERKLRLFAVACCRRVWHLLSDDRSRAALEAVELYVDGSQGAADLNAACRAAADTATEIVDFPYADAAHAAYRTAAGDDFDPGYAAADTAPFAAANAAVSLWPEAAATYDTYRALECAVQSQLFRDIFGNPFRPAALDPAWRTETVLALARGIYEERAFDRMPILADALQDAGCTDEDVLGHCRGPGPHARGCWVVDLILGKT